MFCIDMSTLLKVFYVSNWCTTRLL